MSRKAYFIITAVIIAIVVAGFLIPVPEIIALSKNTLKLMQSPYLTVAALACAFVFLTSKHYWLIMLGCAVATALAMQFFFVNSGFHLNAFCYRIFTFCIIVFFLNVIRVAIKK